MQLLQGFDADRCAVGAYRTLQCLHHMGQLYPRFMQVLHAHQFLQVEFLHVLLQRMLGPQALYTEHQHQQQ
ncbi:hypothetical protein D3C84_568480 [compost metagenome]